MSETTQTFQIYLSPKNAADEQEIKNAVGEMADLPDKRIKHIKVVRRSIDARKKPVRISLKVEMDTETPSQVEELRRFQVQKVNDQQEVVVVGAGPAGLFSAIRLIELGYRPIILERGKNVSDRKKDIALLNRNEGINPDSNYCFGEGGAGTFSDGKLYTRSKKRGEIKDILELLVSFGATPDILVDSHPHIGSDKLPGIIQNIRQAIIEAGGHFAFSTKLSDLEIVDNRIRKILTSTGEVFENLPMVLATGHSARDIYEILKRNSVLMEAKGFAMGVRVEHPQEMIDKIQYHTPFGRGDYLPAATYNIAAQMRDRGVYSFCMCPGGTIVPGGTEDGTTVVNGMSNSSRNSPFANSGLVVEIRESDIPEYTNKFGVFAGLAYQKELETLAYRNGGRGFVAPGQRISDFIAKRPSGSLPESSYNPGLVSSPMHFWLPEAIGERLRGGLQRFERKMKGYGSSEGILVGVESRTSSPIRIPRKRETFEHVEVEGLFPCGEGAGYAGGIVSSALDGFQCAEGIHKKFTT